MAVCAFSSRVQSIHNQPRRLGILLPARRLQYIRANGAQAMARLNKEEALSFLLTHLVVERGETFEMNPLTLFHLMHLAAEAENRMQQEQGVIPHEVIEEITDGFES